MPNPRWRWLRDPLLLFLGAGALIFAGWWLVQRRGDEIRLTPAIRAALAQDHQARTGHTPSAAEHKQLIEDWVAEEILFREAVARGLHLNDPVTRERLVERLTLMVGGVGREPAEADLLDHFATNMSRYRAEPQISFEHRFFVRPPADPAAMLARLRAGKAVAGDDFWMGQQFQGYGVSMLRGLFGKTVLDAAQTVPIGQWHGPYRSARGVHFIRVESRAPARAMTYLAAREQVKMDWLAATASAPIAQELARVRGKYRVVDE